MERSTRPLWRLRGPRDDRSEPLGVQAQFVIAFEDAWRVRVQHRQQRFRQCEPLSGVSLQFRQCEGEPIPEQRFEHRADRLAHGQCGPMHFERSAEGRQLAIKTCTDDLVVHASFQFATTPTCHRTS